MTRNRPGPRRRRQLHKDREKLRQLMARAEKENAQAASSANTTSPAQDSAPDADKNASTVNLGGHGIRPRAKCKHRHLPDRHYYQRSDSMDLRYLAFQRRINHQVDDKVAEASAVLGTQDRRNMCLLSHLSRKVDRQLEQTRRELGYMRQAVKRGHGMLALFEEENDKLRSRLQSMEDLVDRLEIDRKRRRRHEERMRCAVSMTEEELFALP
ncbi:hypothetical protein F66182_2815 [Fusarium sp. NRRL 66182]|nr:hypothetical protein F66182_2815 [Fusarium sp. NRRL 66182]